MATAATDHAADIEHAAQKAADEAEQILDFWLEALSVEVRKEAYKLAAKKLADSAELFT